MTPVEMINYFKNQPMRFKPGTKWEYNNSPAMNSKEMKTLQLLKKGINWVDFDADKSGIIGEGVLKKVG